MFGFDDGFTRTTRQSRSAQLHFGPSFLMFVSPLDLFAQATQQGNGWTLVKTTATTLDHRQTTP